MDTAISVLYWAQETGPVGSEFGKASPFGWLLIVALMAIVLYIGWAFHRRYMRLNRRRIFAEEHGLDPFDVDAVEKAMAEAGLQDKSKKRWF